MGSTGRPSAYTLKGDILDDGILGIHMMDAQQLIGLNPDVLEQNVVDIGTTDTFAIGAYDIEGGFRVGNRHVRYDRVMDMPLSDSDTDGIATG